MSTAAQGAPALLSPRTSDADPACPPKPPETLGWLPAELTLDIPVVGFRVRDLLSLREGMIVETLCHHTSDIPLRVNGALIGWTEFEVVGDRLAVRITELA